jgi:hypothetical protein
MSAARRSRLLLVTGLAAALVGGCGGGSDESVSNAKIVAKLDMTKVQGRYAIGGNPFCSVSKLLGDSHKVDDARSSHSVIASRDGTIGVEIVRPFAPPCRKKAQKRLNHLAGLGRHHRHKRGGQHGKAKHGNHGGSRKGGGNGGQA